MIQKALFEINSKPLTLFYTCSPFQDLSPMELLDRASITPKIYFSLKDSDHSSLALGELFHQANFPIIRSIDNPHNIIPRFFGAQNFALSKSHPSFFSSSYFVLPKYIIEFTKSETLLHTFALSENDFSSLSLAPFEKPSASDLHLSHRKDTPNDHQWNELFDFVQKKIQEKKIDKCVLARKTTFKTLKEIPATYFLNRLSKRQKNTSIFSFEITPGHVFLGATPEKLFSRKNNQIETEAIAGTLKGENKVELLNSIKNTKEVLYVSDFLEQKLNHLCVDVQKSDLKPFTAGHLTHLRQFFKGTLKDNITDFNLIKQLHPTPAIGGSPQKEVYELLLHLETFDRGWYASPLSMASENETQCLVGIRSALIKPYEIELFAGCGILEGSNALSEWEELEAKISIFLEEANLHV